MLFKNFIYIIKGFGVLSNTGRLKCSDGLKSYIDQKLRSVRAIDIVPARAKRKESNTRL